MNCNHAGSCWLHRREVIGEDGGSVGSLEGTTKAHKMQKTQVAIKRRRTEL